MDTGPAAKEGVAGPVAVQAGRGAANPASILLDGLRGARPALAAVRRPRVEQVALWNA